MVRNVHERFLATTGAPVGALLDTLGSEHDRLWPSEGWPALRLDRGLTVGSKGGHGPVSYEVRTYEPGRRVEFDFVPPFGLVGSHSLAVIEVDDGVILRHRLTGTPRGRMRLLWPLVVRWLHDALIEDALDKAEVAVGGTPAPKRRSLWVRTLRTWLGPKLNRAAPVRS